MPALRLHTQPSDRALVNIPTILHTTPQTLRRTVTLLGHTVHLEATPTHYTWHHGDGTHHTTTHPGRPYPGHNITHTYKHTADRVELSVDTTYTVRYRTDDGPWTPLGQTLTAPGPTTTLTIEQAAPVLTHP